MFAASLAIKQYIANRTTEKEFYTKYAVDYDEAAYYKNELLFTRGAKQDVCMILGDTFISTTTCVLGVLGILSVIGMTPVAAYALISVSGTITLSWIVMTVKSRGLVLNYSKNLLSATMTSPKKPQNGTEEDNETFDSALTKANTFMEDHCRDKEVDLREILFGKVQHLVDPTQQ